MTGVYKLTYQYEGVNYEKICTGYDFDTSVQGCLSMYFGNSSGRIIITAYKIMYENLMGMQLAYRWEHGLLAVGLAVASRGISFYICSIVTLFIVILGYIFIRFIKNRRKSEVDQ